MLRSIKSAQRKLRLISLRIEGSTGTASLEGLDKEQCTIAAGGSDGNYVITFKSGFAEKPQVVANSETEDVYVSVSSTKTTATVACRKMNVTSGVNGNQHADVQVLILGSDITDRY